MDTTFIYALRDPENGQIRYVGKSNNPKKRASRHLTSLDGNCRRINWIKSLLARGLKPALEIIDEVPEEHWQQLEVAYIEFFRASGVDLTNFTEGGDSGPSLPGNKNPRFGKPGVMLGKKHKLESREKRKIATRGSGNPFFGHKHAPEFCARQKRKKPGASSNFFGVYKASNSDKWRAAIRVLEKKKALGSFSEETEAAQAYDTAAKKYHGAFTKLNFPD